MAGMILSGQTRGVSGASAFVSIGQILRAGAPGWPESGRRAKGFVQGGRTLDEHGQAFARY
jgi:hypothetical protein